MDPVELKRGKRGPYFLHQPPAERPAVPVLSRTSAPGEETRTTIPSRCLWRKGGRIGFLVDGKLFRNISRTAQCRKCGSKPAIA